MLKLHSELAGPIKLPVEEVKIVEELTNGKKRRKKRNMEKYAPLIFEECYIKNKNASKVANAFELSLEPHMQDKVDPTSYSANYRGTHVFILCHGF